MRRCLGVLGVVLGTVVAQAQEPDSRRPPARAGASAGVDNDTFAPGREAKAESPRPALPDGPLTSYTVEVTVVDAVTKAGEQRPFDLSKSAREVLAQIQKAQGANASTRVRHIRLTAVDGLQSMVQYGQVVPVPEGRTVNFGGRAAQMGTSYRNTNIGVIVQVTARAVKDGIAAELTFEESRLEENPPSETDEGTNVVPPTTDTSSARTTVTFQPGEPVVVGGMSTSTDAKRHDKVILATITPNE